MAIKGLSKTIGRQEWLEPVEQALSKGVQSTFQAGGSAGKKTQDFLHGTWLGHPLHVVLTDLPLGAWTAAIVFDSVEAITDRDEFGAAADACVGFGLVGAIGAAVTGLTDWHQTDPPARRVGLVHGVLNLLGTSLFAASWVNRRKDRRGLARGLSTLGYLIAGVSAQLGGHLVYDHRIGVDHAPAQGLPEDFVPVLGESELLPGTPTRAAYNGLPILLVRRGDEIYAIAETCSHLGGPLAEGRLDGDVIQCPWHGSQFSVIDGSVVGGPAVHPQPCLETRVNNGQIEVRSERSLRGVQTGDVTSAPPIAAERLPRTGTDR